MDNINGAKKFTRNRTIYPPQGYAFWDPKSEGSAFPYFPCTGDFEFLLKIPIGSFLLYVGPVLWRVETSRFFELPPVRGPCVVVCGDFAFFKVPPCVGSVLWCVGTLRKVPLCVWGL